MLESIRRSVASRESPLCSCNDRRAGQFKYPAVQRYLHDLSGEMGEHIDSITSSLSVFIEIGLSHHVSLNLYLHQITLVLFGRCADHPIRTETRKPELVEPQYGGDILLRCHRDNHAVLV